MPLLAGVLRQRSWHRAQCTVPGACPSPPIGLDALPTPHCVVGMGTDCRGLVLGESSVPLQGLTGQADYRMDTAPQRSRLGVTEGDRGWGLAPDQKPGDTGPSSSERRQRGCCSLSVPHGHGQRLAKGKWHRRPATQQAVHSGVGLSPPGRGPVV